MSGWQEQRTLFLSKEQRMVVLWIFADTLNAYAGGPHPIKKQRLGGCGKSFKNKEGGEGIVRELGVSCEISGLRIPWIQHQHLMNTRNEQD